ncbi:ATP-binding cassette domain-containing protein [bacterium]|nr:ATP-binding cassette domain-containing protein [bacterium]
MHKLSGKIILELKDVDYTHPSNSDASSEPALRKINFKIREGDSVSVIGPSGCGKSTLLRLLNRMADPDNGRIFYKDKPLKEHDVLNLRREILLVPQEIYIVPGTLADNLKIVKRDEEITDDELHHVLNSVGLGSKPLHLDSTSMSVGEKHRLALARAFLLNPKILLLDEPAASLDLPAARGIIDTISGFHEKFDNTVIMVTHRFRLARRIGGSVVMLDKGRIVETAESLDFFRNPQSPQAQRFIKDAGED